LTENRFLEAIAVGKRPIQASLWNPSPLVAEIVATSGFDAVFLDLQHGAVDISDVYVLAGVLLANGVTPTVRIPSLDPALIGRALDAGVYGVICPDVQTVEAARAFVSACKYPPEGTRGFGSSRAQIGLPGSHVDREARFSTTAENAAVMAIVQIESPLGLENVEAIMATPGVNGVFPGMVDYALEAHGELLPSLSFLDERVREPLERIIAAAHTSGRSVGLAAASVDEVRPLLELGADWIHIGSDRGWVRAGARQTVAGAREATRLWAAEAGAGAEKS